MLIVSKDGGQMTVVLNRKRRIAVPPDVTGRSIVAMVALIVCRRQPPHPAPEVAVVVRAEDNVKMVRHPAIAEEIHR